MVEIFPDGERNEWEVSKAVRKGMRPSGERIARVWPTDCRRSRLLGDFSVSCRPIHPRLSIISRPVLYASSLLCADTLHEVPSLSCIAYHPIQVSILSRSLLRQVSVRFAQFHHTLPLPVTDRCIIRFLELVPSPLILFAFKIRYRTSASISSYRNE